MRRAAEQSSEANEIFFTRNGEKARGQLAGSEQAIPIGDLLSKAGLLVRTGIRAKIRVTGKELVRTLAGHDCLHMDGRRARQHELGGAVTIDDGNLAMPNGIEKILRNVPVAHLHEMVLHPEP